MHRLALIAMFASTCVLAETYIWTDADGRKHYSDQPPPASVKTEKKDFGPGKTDAVSPYAVRVAARRNPVTLYTGESCPLCVDARKLLEKRGVPFKEKKIATQEDQDALLERFDGNGIVPSIQIGKAKAPGYTAEQWNTMLTEAGYPESLRGLQ